jgi:hypothetical protein
MLQLRRTGNYRGEAFLFGLRLLIDASPVRKTLGISEEVEGCREGGF